MAHMASYKREAAVGVLRHDERHPGDGVAARKNEQIDPQRTKYNYNLAPERHGSLKEHLDFLSKTGVRVSKRKDLNVMVSWVITLPKNVPTYEHRKFFEGVYQFLVDRYGGDSVLTAAVHLDETTPHMHFGFVPIAIGKDGQRTVSSKLICTRSELLRFHKDLSRNMEQVMGYQCEIENGATAAGNKAIDELKRETAKENLQILVTQKEKAVQEALEASKKVLTVKQDLQDAQNALGRIREATKDSIAQQKKAEAAKDEAMAAVAAMQPSQAIQDAIDAVQQGKKRKRNGNVIVSGEALETLIDAAKSVAALRCECDSIQQQLTDMRRQRDDARSKVAEQDKKLQSQRDEISQLLTSSKNIREYEKLVDNALRAVSERYPDAYKAYQDVLWGRQPQAQRDKDMPERKSETYQIEI